MDEYRIHLPEQRPDHQLVAGPALMWQDVVAQRDDRATTSPGCSRECDVGRRLNRGEDREHHRVEPPGGQPAAGPSPGTWPVPGQRPVRLRKEIHLRLAHRQLTWIEPRRA